MDFKIKQLYLVHVLDYVKLVFFGEEKKRKMGMGGGGRKKSGHFQIHFKLHPSESDKEASIVSLWKIFCSPLKIGIERSFAVFNFYLLNHVNKFC